MNYQSVLDFWFAPENSKKLFIKDANFDQEIRDRFLSFHHAAAQGELYSWRESALGRLAEIIILDQFSRNMFRDTPDAFRFDPIAIVLTQEALAQKADTELPTNQKSFFYMPMMHSESKIIHEYSLAFFDQPGLEGTYKFELLHKKIIDRFGRYPHRNEILSRASTAEEIAFLKEENSSF